MKSNEEFIAGIYEKAAAYTEEKEKKVIRVNFAARAVRIAAMFAVCLGLAGVGIMLPGNPDETPDEGGTAGIARMSDEGMPLALSGRMIPELSYLEGEVEELKEEEQIAFVRLRIAGENAAPASERALVAVRLETEENLRLEDVIWIGMQIKVGGTTLERGYRTEAAEYLLLTVTTKGHIWIWSEESGEYINLGNNTTIE